MPATSRSKTSRADVQVSEAVRWYVWDGGFLAIGRAQGVVPRHAHHAIQIAGRRAEGQAIEHVQRLALVARCGVGGERRAPGHGGQGGGERAAARHRKSGRQRHGRRFLVG